jgi:hypothetical protein
LKVDVHRPSFFLVGAPKAGTTSLYDYLASHPRIFLPPKELHFFGDEWSRWTEREYLSFFPARGRYERVGEASVRYFASASAARGIRDFEPSAQIIVLLRHPVEAVVSMHRDQVFLGQEPCLDLREALAKEAERRRATPAGQSNPLLYREQVNYAGHLRRWVDLFGWDRIYVGLFDDIRKDMQTEFRRVLRFLGLDEVSAPTPRRANPAKEVRSPRFRRLILHHPAWVTAVARRAIPAPVRVRMWRRLMLLNSRPTPSSHADHQLLVTLTEELVDQVNELRSLLGRELPGWTSPPTNGHR